MSVSRRERSTCALSAHLAACQSGMFLLIVGALWKHMHFAQSWWRSGTLFLIVYGMYAIP